MGEGYTTSEIGRRLDLQPTTVRRHVSDILKKLGVSDRRRGRSRCSRKSPASAPVPSREVRHLPLAAVLVLAMCAPAHARDYAAPRLRVQHPEPRPDGDAAGRQELDRPGGHVRRAHPGARRGVCGRPLEDVRPERLRDARPGSDSCREDDKRPRPNRGRQVGRAAHHGEAALRSWRSDSGGWSPSSGSLLMELARPLGRLAILDAPGNQRLQPGHLASPVHALRAGGCDRRPAGAPARAQRPEG